MIKCKKNLDVSTWFCLFFVFACTIFGWSPVYDCKAYLETNTVKNCSYFGFGGNFWQQEHPTISRHYPANMSCQSCFLDLTPNSRYQFTSKYVAARGEN